VCGAAGLRCKRYLLWLRRAWIRHRSPEGPAFITAAWRRASQVTESERMPFSRMLASVIGGPR
jgi:hypothetical protein